MTILSLPYEVYIVMIDSKGILAFQSFTRDRWAKCEAIYKQATNPKKSHLLFKIKLSEKESNITKRMIQNKTFMHAADYVLRIKNKRGEVK